MTFGNIKMVLLKTGITGMRMKMVIIRQMTGVHAMIKKMTNVDGWEQYADLCYEQQHTQRQNQAEKQNEPDKVF